MTGVPLCVQGSITIKDGKLEMKVKVAGSSEGAGRTKDMKQLSGGCCRSQGVDDKCHLSMCEIVHQR